MASYRSRDDDAFIDEDIGYPNLKSQYRGYRYTRWFVFVAGILAVVFGLIEGGKNVLGAFTSFSSLSERAAWVKLLAGLGTLTEIGLLVVVVALIWRWRTRRSASRRRKPKAT
jgi:hypothetical protein